MFKEYRGKYINEISMPLGGIGAGCIGLAGNGRLIDWEIFNRPNKCSDNGYSHFAVKAERNGELLDARVLCGDVDSEYTGRLGEHWGLGKYGAGMPQTTMAGFPHFAECVFRGAYPTAQLEFSDAHFPGTPKLNAFSVMIPHNDRDSSIPAAFYEVEITNTTSAPIEYTAALSVCNPWGGSQNTLVSRDDYSAVKMTQNRLKKDEIGYGDLTFAAFGGEISAQQYWYRGMWFDHVETYWRNFKLSSGLKNRVYDDAGNNDHATLAVKLTADAGETVRARFVICWNCPNLYNYWSPYKVKNPDGTESDYIWHNYYTSLFADSAECADYAVKNYGRLKKDTFAFRDAVFGSTLPDEVKEAAMSALEVLKSPTVLRFENGDIYGWEGCGPKEGSCEGSCTHVWNYAYAMAFLFPELERNLRENDFKYNQGDDGKMSFRTLLPLGRGKNDFRACVDGQMGGVIKTYREWKICGDNDWLRSLWPMVKKSLEYAWSPSNPDRWDLDRDGVLEGRQHHTLDMELFGPSSWLEGFYLAALKAGAEMAEAMGEHESAAQYLSLYEKGRAFTDEKLWNGEYYAQKIDLSDRALVSSFEGAEGMYWNFEANEIKYQIADGCEIDQMCAQWHAAVCGIGDIFDHDKRVAALKSLYKYNYLPSVREHFNSFRLYAVNDEAATIMCAYPQRIYTPAIPLPYAQESMHGFEYQLAALMMSEGMLDEGLDIVRAIRARYDGRKRNPYNEIEWGSNYARSMASWSMLPILSGMSFDLTRGMIGFDPKVSADAFRCFWSLGGAWGMFTSECGISELGVYSGNITLCEIKVPHMKSVKSVEADGKAIDFEWDGDSVKLKNKVNIEKSIILRS